MKVCRKCKTERPLGEFYKSSRTKSGLQSICKPCNYDELKAWRKKPGNLIGEKIRAHKITVEEYSARLARQNNCCAICGRDAKQFSERLYVDHDHNCCPGQYSCGLCVRGLLCRNCNTGLGCFADSVDRMTKALVYLEGQVGVSAFAFYGDCLDGNLGWIEGVAESAPEIAK